MKAVTTFVGLKMSSFTVSKDEIIKACISLMLRYLHTALMAFIGQTMIWYENFDSIAFVGQGGLTISTCSA
jgi:hypothetical protein